MADLFTTPSWESVMGSRPRTRTRVPTQTPLPGGGYTTPGTSVNDGVLTSPGIPESEVNQPERPPTPGPALPVPRYEDMLNAAPGPDWSAAAPLARRMAARLGAIGRCRTSGSTGKAARTLAAGSPGYSAG